MLNAAPGLNARVKRTTLPTIECGMCAGTRYRTASTFVKKSRTTTATAAVQNTRPLWPGAVIVRAVGSGQLSGFDRHGRGDRGGDTLGLGVLTPQHPSEQERTEAHRHVGNVERRPPRIAKADVDEVDDPSRRADSIDEIADRAAADQGQREGAHDVAGSRRRVE